MLIKKNPEIKKKKKNPQTKQCRPLSHKIKKEPTPKSLPNLKTEKERGRRRLRLRGRRRVREREGEKELLSAAPETQKLKKNNMDSLFFLASPLILLVHVCT